MKTFIYFLFLLISIAMVSSCKQEGCTDPRAINYNVIADEDDGSCIICEKSVVPYDSMDLQLVDKRAASLYYNDTVGRFHLMQYLEIPNDNVCGKEISYVKMNLINFVGESMFVDFDITEVNGPLNVNYSNAVDVPPYGTYEFGNIVNINYPPFYKITLDSLKVTLTGYIQYY